MRARNFVGIFAVSLALAAYSSWVLSQRPGPPGAPAGSVPAAGIPLIRLPQAEAYWRDGSTLFLDARSAIDHAYGHIPGAVSLPEEEFEARLPELRPRLERARRLVVYCKSEDCGRSLWVALRLWDAGLKQTLIYPAGWNEWYLRGLPVHRTATR